MYITFYELCIQYDIHSKITLAHSIICIEGILAYLTIAIIFVLFNILDFFFLLLVHYCAANSHTFYNICIV